MPEQDLTRVCPSCGIDPATNPNLPPDAPIYLKELQHIEIRNGCMLKLCDCCWVALRGQIAEPYKRKIVDLETKLGFIREIMARR